MTVRGTRPERHLAPGSNTGAAPASPGETDASDAPAWGYEPHNGPARWAALDPAFSVCASGREQSPIELTGARRADLSPVCFDYRRTRVAVENTGHVPHDVPVPGIAHDTTLHGGRRLGDPDRAAHAVAAQIDTFAAIHPNNYRPVQRLGERVLVRG